MPSGKTHPPKRPIQPFVPVRGDEHTELYSHKELCALTAMDPRNELDELSEPFRFKKDLTKPDAFFESEGRHRRGGSVPLTFLAGVAIGGVVVAFTASKIGSELRWDLEGKGQTFIEKWRIRALALRSGWIFDDLKEGTILAAVGLDRGARKAANDPWRCS